jgi:hypothetical protein
MAPAVSKRARAPAQLLPPQSANIPAPMPPSDVSRADVPSPDIPVSIGDVRMPAQVRAALQRLRSEVETNCTYVGPAFAEEARRMQRGESDHRGIYGETTPEQAETLAEEGIQVARIPWVPRADG